MQRDSNGAPERSFKLGSLEVDLESYRATLADKPLELSPSQLEMLGILLSNIGRVTSREELSKAVGLRRGRSVDVMLCTLRKELGRDFIRNVRNRGWIVDPDVLTT
ncbi:MAG TPA: winged helix-turn-helix domain-containing protein [Actinomycetota bacterium]|nr:winged helix-turn-helix domain-containing protein [Actinomycetota bacterium]